MEEKGPLKQEKGEGFDCDLDQPVTKYKWYQINTYSLPSKMGYFCESARRISYTPSLVIFLTSIGLSKGESGFIAGFRLIGMLLGGPFWGMIADKWNCHRTIIIVTCMTAVLLMCSQPFLSVQYGNPILNRCRYIDNSTTFIYQNCTGAGRNCSYYWTSSNSTTSAFQAQPIEDVSSRKYGKLFFVMFFVYLAVAFFEGSPIAFVDTATIRRCQLSTHRKIHYGKQRMFAAFGASSAILVSNLCIEYFPRANVTCYSGMFISYAVFILCMMTALLLLFRGLSFKAAEKQTKDPRDFRKTLSKTLLRRDVGFFYLTAFMAGLLYCPQSSFLFLYLKELQAPSILLSLAVIAGASSAFFGFLFSNRLIVLVGGTWKAIMLSFFMYSLRYLGTSLIENPWLILLFQPLHSVTLCLFLTAGVNHLKEICPVSVITTMLSIFNTLFYGVGTIVGSSISGIVYEKFDGRVLFTGSAVLALLWSVTVGLYTMLGLKRKSKGDDENLKEFA